jgi:hypothetical protein
VKRRGLWNDEENLSLSLSLGRSYEERKGSRFRIREEKLTNPRLFVPLRARTSAPL